MSDLLPAVHRVLRAADHPEADGRASQPGDVSWKFTIPTATGVIVALEGGRGTRAYLRRVVIGGRAQRADIYLPLEGGKTFHTAVPQAVAAVLADLLIREMREDELSEGTA